ncbi:MAG: kynureninase [Bacteroidetes bacterium]|nr:kynureninase [Bacteroidota bacterium]
MNYSTDKNFAVQQDANDSLKNYRDRFYIPVNKDKKEQIYFCGNSLGLQPKTVRACVEQELKDWELMGIEGVTEARNPWLPYHEFLTKQTAHLVGAKENEVVNMNTLSVNLHLMMVSFYRPTKERNKIFIEGTAFPSDQYAVKSQLRFHGYDESSLIEIFPKQGETYIKTEDILDVIEKQGDEIALVMFAGVNYYTGQLFDLKKITEAGHKKGCMVGFDLAHAAGNIDVQLHDWDVDFAVWCNYKYVNGGPGAIAGAFVHERHHADKNIPRFEGWWGNDKQTRFLMKPDFVPIPTVESWQLSNPPILQLASLKASLDIFEEAGINNLREKSKKLTGYLEYLLNENKLTEKLEILTPSDPEQRGCQLSLRFFGNGKEVFNKLISSDVICDWREPDVIRIAPTPLYNKFEEVWEFVEIVKGVIS